MSASEPYIAGVELGGTKTIAVIGRGTDIVERVQISTTTPEETIGAIAAQLREWHAAYRPAGLGVASFGPISLDARYGASGRMLATPKKGWPGADIMGPLLDAMPVPARLHTDVTAAALAEGRWGVARDLSDFVYITVGTGIGMGVVASGHPVFGRLHPEAGHLRVRRLPGDMFAGICPYHGDCLEGLASGPAIAARSGAAADAMPADHEEWIPVADALAEGVVSLLLTLASEMIIFGGGVGVGQSALVPMIRARVVEKLGGYLPRIDDARLEKMIVQAELGRDSGPLGALSLGQWALQRAPGNTLVE